MISIVCNWFLIFKILNLNDVTEFDITYSNAPLASGCALWIQVLDAHIIIILGFFVF